MNSGTIDFTPDTVSSYFRPDVRHQMLQFGRFFRSVQAKDTGTSELQFKTGSTKDGRLILTEIETPVCQSVMRGHGGQCVGRQVAEFRRVAVKEVYTVMHRRGSLHGTWASESIISASDSRLKREVLPLYRSLLEKREQSAGEGAGGEERQDISASSLLRLLVPDGSSDPLNLKLEATDESLRSLPGVVRQMPNQGGRLGISHQDLLAVITLAAKERERRLEALEAQEDAEIAQQEEQNGLIQVPKQQETHEISIHVKGGVRFQVAAELSDGRSAELGTPRGADSGMSKKESGKSVLDLERYLNQPVKVKFSGGREVKGILKGHDAVANLVLDDVQEYLRDPEDPYKVSDETRSLGLVVARGTSVMLICPVDGTEEIANPFAGA
ncbi:Lsm7 [Symbiodinium sp. CCMP2592]|nr:Lsm7 [Symbiodinium sp. CCMP2592]